MHRLGKLPARHDPRTLKLADYVRALPPPPAAVDWSHGIGYGMMRNDTLGDCTIAGAGHLVQTWTANARSPAFVIPDDTIVATYSAFCGYNPADPSTDQGGNMLDVLNRWRNDGVGGHKIAAFAAVNPKNAVEMQQAIALFGGIYTGIALPAAAESQAIWDTTSASPGDSNSWGGHCVPLIGYYPAVQSDWLHRLFGAKTIGKPGAICVTWGATKKLTWDFVTTYMDEAYAIITQDWIEANGKAPSGFDLDALQADLLAITSSAVPVR